MFAWYLNLLSIPVAGLSLIWTCEIWGDQVKCSSRTAPRYFTELVGNNLFLSSLILKELFNFVFCLWKTTKSVFSIFRESLFVLSHIECFLRSWFILFVNISCERSERVTLVSSTKWYALEYFRHEWRSLMQMRNNNGPRTDPWGTPDTISLIVEAWLPMDKKLLSSL